MVETRNSRSHTIIKVALTAFVVLALGGWIVGTVVHLIDLVLKVALVTAVAAFVWHAVGRRLDRS